MKKSTKHLAPIYQVLTSLVAQTVKCLSTMRETRIRSLGREDPLEKKMAIHSSTLAWRIPWTEEPGRLQSIWSQRVKLHWSDLAAAAAQGSIKSLFILNQSCLPGGSDSKASACNAGDLGSIPGLGRSPGEENGNPLQYSCLENSMGRGAWWATFLGISKSLTRLNDFTFTFIAANGL